jgi:hypothetical protein
MSFVVRAFTVLVLILVAAACSGGDTPAPTGTGPAETSAGARVEPEEVAERLLTQLRDEDYAAAHQTLSTGQARDVAANQLDLMTQLTSANTLVREWSLEEPTFVTVDDQSKVEVTGTVTYEDEGTGGVRMVMQALGLQSDPWRIDEFELTRD